MYFNLAENQGTWLPNGTRPVGSANARRMLVRWCNVDPNEMIQSCQFSFLDETPLSVSQKHATEIAMEKCERTCSALNDVMLMHMISLVELVLVFNKYVDMSKLVNVPKKLTFEITLALGRDKTQAEGFGDGQKEWRLL